MHVNIVMGNADFNWIAGRLARELVKRLPAHGVTAEINGRAGDLEYQQIVYGSPSQRPAVGMYTHGEFRPSRYAKEYDGSIALNSAMLEYLVRAGAKNPALIELPIDSRFKKIPIVFGVAGRTYSDGRKGEALIAKMVEEGYTVRAWGSGWPCQIVSSDLEALPDFYRSIDYYVDTSSDEGGCIPALECMAMGIPVISHTVGVDRPVLGYVCQDWQSLNKVLKRLTTPRTYDDWAADHASYFRAVVSQNWEDFWERSA